MKSNPAFLRRGALRPDLVFVLNSVLLLAFLSTGPLASPAAAATVPAQAETPGQAEANPLSTGACCFPDGSCQVLTQADCAQMNGAWLGDGTTCTPNPCPPCFLPCTYGACCLANGNCEWVNQADCDQIGGRFQGGGTICAPNPCGTASTPDPDVKENKLTWGKIRMMYRS